MKKSTLLKNFERNVKVYIKDFDKCQKETLNFYKNQVKAGTITQRKFNNLVKKQIQERIDFLESLETLKKDYAFSRYFSFETEWTRGGIYGQQARTTLKNSYERLQSGLTTGCGYCKHSHSIEAVSQYSQALKFAALATLPKEKISYRGLLRFLGGGVGNLKEFMKNANYKLVSDYENKYTDYLEFELQTLKD